MRVGFRMTVVGVGLGLGLSATALAATPEEILRKADEVRNPSESYFMKVTVTSDGEDRSAFEVSIQGNNKTLVKTREPARDRGRNLLMLEEEMWAYIPNLKRAVRVSLAQKLTGQAANGDISRMRWSGDYTATIEKESPKDWVLHLAARKKGLTYDKARVWIEKGSFHPLKAEFLTPAGKPLKLATYGGYRNLAGKERPGTIRIQDALRPDDVSVIEIGEMAVRSFPASTFNQNALQ
jgi:outer membrane lipoprotein-sorting protein